MTSTVPVTTEPSSSKRVGLQARDVQRRCARIGERGTTKADRGADMRARRSNGPCRPHGGPSSQIMTPSTVRRVAVSCVTAFVGKLRADQGKFTADPRSNKPNSPFGSESPLAEQPVLGREAVGIGCGLAGIGQLRAFE